MPTPSERRLTEPQAPFRGGPLRTLTRLSAFALGAVLLAFAAQRCETPLAGLVHRSTTLAALASSTPAPESPSATVVWKAGDPQLGHWGVATTYQCGTPVNTGATFTFTLAPDGTNCGRNQANPLRDGNARDLVYLADGSTFIWEFDYIDGTPAGSPPGMGADVDARSLIWQIHGNKERRTPCARLGFMNGPNGVSGPQMWGLSDCSGTFWVGSYTPGERDHFKIVARVSTGPTGFTEIFRNGAFEAHHDGANYQNSVGDPWWNFGPYKWRWELAGGGGSSMTQVNATIDNMVVTKE